MIKKKKIVYINEAHDFDDDFIDEEDEFIDESDSLNEDGEEGPADNQPAEPMDEEKLRIESLKLATSVAKLMENVTPEDIIIIAGMLAEFIRNNKNGEISSEDVADFGNPDKGADMGGDEDFADEGNEEDLSDEEDNEESEE